MQRKEKQCSPDFCCTSQDLEGERVANNQLQADLAMYKETLEFYQTNHTEQEKRLRAMQDMYDMQQVAVTVQDVPGVDSATLLEVFSAAFVKLQRECSNLKANTVRAGIGGGSRMSALAHADDAEDSYSQDEIFADCSEPDTIRNLLHAMRPPLTSLDYEKVLEALGSGMLGQQVRTFTVTRL